MGIAYEVYQHIVEKRLYIVENATRFLSIRKH